MADDLGFGDYSSDDEPPLVNAPAAKTDVAPPATTSSLASAAAAKAAPIVGSSAATSSTGPKRTPMGPPKFNVKARSGNKGNGKRGKTRNWAEEVASAVPSSDFATSTSTRGPSFTAGEQNLLHDKRNASVKPDGVNANKSTDGAGGTSTSVQDAGAGAGIIQTTRSSSKAIDEKDDDGEDESSSDYGGPMPEQKKGEDEDIFQKHFEIKERHKKPITAMTFDQSASIMVSGCLDGQLHYFNFHGMDLECEPYRSLNPVESHPINSLAMQHRTQNLLVSCADTHVRIYGTDAMTAEPICTTARGDNNMRDTLQTKGHTTAVNQAHWHSEMEKWFISCSTDGTCRLWNMLGKRKVGLDQHLAQEHVFRVLDRRNCFVGGPRGVHATACALDPVSCKKLVAGCNDGSLQLFFVDKPDRKPLILRNAHNGSITDLKFFDGKLVSRSRDGTMKLWNAAHVFGPNLQPIHVWSDLPSEDSDKTNIVFLTDLRGATPQTREMQTLVATCCNGSRSSVEIFNFAEPYQRVQVMYLDQPAVFLAYPVVRGNEFRNCVEDARELQELAAAEKARRKQLLQEQQAAFGGVKRKALKGNNDDEAADDLASGRAIEASKTKKNDASSSSAASGAQPQHLDAEENSDSDSNEEEIEGASMLLSDSFKKLTQLPDYEAIQRKRKLAQEEKKRRRRLRRAQKALGGTLDDLLRQSKQEGGNLHAIPEDGDANIRGNGPAGADEDEDLTSLVHRDPEIAQRGLGLMQAYREQQRIAGSNNPDAALRSKKDAPRPLRQLFVGLRSGTIRVLYNPTYSKRGVLHALLAGRDMQRKKEQKVEQEMGYAIFAADDKDAFWQAGIRLNRDGSIREMGYRGKMRVKTELERRAKDESELTVFNKPEPIADPFEQEMIERERNDRTKLSVVTKTILGMQGITLNQQGKAVMPDGLTRLHDENPQEILQKFQPKKEEEIVYMRAYKDNPTILDYSAEDENDQAARMLRGNHCPKCGRKLCTCGYMRQLNEEQDALCEPVAKRNRVA
ncbi:unnamed protein product [Amoebophrya sp. A25]|nr:unnamed protein product [Amoebophrya sp. A25]|eukprot:GSA25T00018758001.1